MKIIVGLGNPGDKYKNTRHNIGFQIVDLFKREENLSSFSDNKKLNSLISQNNSIIIAKPNTFMNNSGAAVIGLIKYYKINMDDLIIVHDDLDLPFGIIKVQYNKNAAGHHGVESIIEYLKSKEFHRLRFGIAGDLKETIPGEKYVLSKFSCVEEEKLNKLSQTAISELKNWSNQK